MTNAELHALQNQLNSMDGSLKEVLGLLKDDKFGQPGLVTRFNMAYNKMRLIEKKQHESKQELQDKLAEQEKKHNQESAFLKAKYDREISNLNLKVVKIYWTTGAVSSTIALVISILVLVAKAMGGGNF